MCTSDRRGAPRRGWRAPDRSIRGGGSNDAARKRRSLLWGTALKVARFHFLGSPLYDAYARNLRATNYRLGRERASDLLPGGNRNAVGPVSRLDRRIQHHDKSSTCLLNNRDRAHNVSPRVSRARYINFMRAKLRTDKERKISRTRVRNVTFYLTGGGNGNSRSQTARFNRERE